MLQSESLMPSLDFDNASRITLASQVPGTSNRRHRPRCMTRGLWGKANSGEPRKFLNDLTGMESVITHTPTHAGRAESIEI